MWMLSASGSELDHIYLPLAVTGPQIASNYEMVQHICCKVESDAKIFSEFMLEKGTPARNAVSLLLFTSMIDDPLNILLNYSKIMEELCIFFFLVISMRRMGVRELWGGEKATQTTSFAGINKKWRTPGTHGGCWFGLAWMSKCFSLNTSWLPLLVRRISLAREHYYSKIFQCVFEIPLLIYTVERKIHLEDIKNQMLAWKVFKLVCRKAGQLHSLFRIPGLDWVNLGYFGKGFANALSIW